MKKLSKERLAAIAEVLADVEQRHAAVMDAESNAANAIADLNTEIAKLNEAVVKAFSDPLVIKRLGDLGQDLPAREQLTPQALGALHKAEVAKWWPLIKAANIRVE